MKIGDIVKVRIRNFYPYEVIYNGFKGKIVSFYGRKFILKLSKTDKEKIELFNKGRGEEWTDTPMIHESNLVITTKNLSIE